MKKTLKKILVTMLAAMILLTGCGADAEQNQGQETGAAQGNEAQTEGAQNGEIQDERQEEVNKVPLEGADVTWQEFVADMGMGWNLGNTFDAVDLGLDKEQELEYEYGWLTDKVKTTQEMISAVKAQGFNTIRIPVSWHNHVEITKDDAGNKTYTIREAWLNRIQEVVDYCFNEDLYVILNIHHDDRIKRYIYPTDEAKDNSKAYLTCIWTQVAERFADYDMHLIFETMNEVRLTGTEDEWNASSANGKAAQKIINEYNQTAVDAIRNVKSGYNSARFIMCPGYAASVDSRHEYVLPIDNGGYENRIIVAVHAYTPYDFCMDRTANGKSVYDGNVQSAIKSLFYTIEETWIAKDIPVVIGEWGVIMKDDNAEARLKYVNQYVTRAVTSCQDSEGATVTVPCILWDNGYAGPIGKNETYGSLNRVECTWYDQAYVDQIITSSKAE